MKKIMLLAVLLGIAATVLFAQGNETPAAVKSKFSSLYPKATSVKWEKENGNYEAEFKLNNVEKELTLNYIIAGDVIELNGSLNLLDFKGEKAVDALNKACKDLHKGEDGKSKTWSDVNIYVKSTLKNSCK